MIHTIILTVILAYKLLVLHGAGGHEIDINPNEISSVRDPFNLSEGHVAKDIRCLLFMTNGKVIGVTEDCHTVKMMIEMEK